MTIWTRICYSNIFSSILYSNCCIPSCAEDDEEDDEDGAVEAVVDVPQSRSLHLKFFTAWSDWCEILGRACYLDKADGGESSGENDEKSNCLADRGMLDLEKTQDEGNLVDKGEEEDGDKDKDGRLTRRMYLRKSHSSSLFSNRCRLKIREKTAW